jgi:hypothetical protein
MPTRLLLIPDLHFLGSTDGEKEAGTLIGAYRELFPGQPVQLIISVGDLSDRAAPDGFMAAKTFFASLRGEFEVPILFTPGNHDLKSSLEPSFYSLVREEEAFERFAPMKSFSEGARVSFVDGHPQSFVAFVEGRDGPPVCIFGVNSSRIQRPACLGLGYVGLDQLVELREAADNLLYDELRRKDRRPFALAVTHYNLLPAAHWTPDLSDFMLDFFDTYRRSKLSFLIDSAPCLSFMEEHNILRLAHGHSHQPPVMLHVRGYCKAREGRTSQPIKVVDVGKFVQREESSGARAFTILDYQYDSQSKQRITNWVNTVARFVRFGDVKANESPQENVVPAAPFTQPEREQPEEQIFQRNYGIAMSWSKRYNAWIEFFAARSKGQPAWDDYLGRMATTIEVIRVQETRRAPEWSRREIMEKLREVSSAISNSDLMRLPSPRSRPDWFLYEKIFK